MDSNDASHSSLTEDGERVASEKLESVLLDGLLSGEPVVADESFWIKQRDRLNAYRDTKSAA